MFRDKNKVLINVGDEIEKDGIKYIIKFIISHTTATVVIAENVESHQVETLLLHDVKKI